MLSSTEMVMNTNGKMVSLEELIKSAGGGGISVISSIEDLPEADKATLDVLFMINEYAPEEENYISLFDAEGDKTKMLDGAVDSIIPLNISFDDFYELKITGAYFPTGEIWTNGAAVISDYKSMIGKNFSIKDNGGNRQGDYTILNNGLFVNTDVYGNCVIDKIEGKRKAIYPTVLTTVKDGNIYKWVDIINKKEVN